MIRRATIEDKKELILLGMEQYLEEGTDDFGLGYNLTASWPITKEWINGNGGAVWVLEINGKLQGFTMWNLINLILDPMQPIFHEVGLYVRKEFRGKGWGSKLINTALDFWAEKGGGMASLGIAAVGTPEYLKEHYERKGFLLYEMMFFKNIPAKEKKE